MPFIKLQLGGAYSIPTVCSTERLALLRVSYRNNGNDHRLSVLKDINFCTFCLQVKALNSDITSHVHTIKPQT
uniref:Uncharacterized protein n=1 Tax=Anguilla anguilla TaxID=7936 RepID=A0A0E9SNY2_ANGAN